MSAARNPQLGSVIWAEMEDANGYRKTRPVVVVSPTADVKAGKERAVKFLIGQGMKDTKGGDEG